MQKTSRASTSSSTRRSIVFASVIASSAALLAAAGCQIEATPAPPDPMNGKPDAGAGGVTGNGGSGNTGGMLGAGGTSTAGGASGGVTGGSGGAGTGGTVAGTGAVSAGIGGTGAGSAGVGGVAAGSGGMSSGGMGGAAKPCVDVEPPPDPEWPDANCQKWATETTECSAAWFANYCDASCGRCVPEGGGGGMGSGGMGSGGMGAAGKPCVDVQPPPDPEWPDATCENWATETTECTAAWFANYCDVSCGRCVPEGGTAGTGGQAGVDCSTQGLPNVTGGNGYATRYWDCCQTHCAQFNGHRCAEDGTSQTGSNQSACSGGNSFACYDEAPRAVSECLSYGNIAKSNPNCGGCYRIQFTGEGQYNPNDPGSKLIKGKQMIVKVTNTGGDVGGNQFDLMIPGGGVGQFNACSRQWGTNDLGAQYGGFLTNCTGSHAAKKDCVRQNCMKIPAGKAREGCLWFVDWFQVADNPKFTSEPTNCPF